MREYRVAILGCGPRGRAAALAYSAHPRTRVAAVCDVVAERAAALAALLEEPARYTAAERMLAVERPDVVVVPTGTELHYPLALQALRAGCHVDVEKPLATVLAHADELVDEAARRGLVLAVHHQTRVGPELGVVLRELAAGRIGRPRHVHASGKGYYGGYDFMNIGTHLVTNVLALVGPCRAVTATATRGGRPVTPDDVVVAPGGMGVVLGERLTALLAFDDGVSGTLFGQRFPRADGTAYSLEIHGDEGRLFWKNTGVWWLPVPHFVPDGQHDRWEPLPVPAPALTDPTGRAHRDDLAYVEEMVRALDEGRAHACSGAAARHVLEVLLGAMESAALGTRVALPQPRRDDALLRWRRSAGLPDPEPGPRPYGEWLAWEDARLGHPSG